MASNYVVALVDAAAMLMDAAGIEPEQGAAGVGAAGRGERRQRVAHSARSRRSRVPCSAGDLLTISGHLSALRQAPESVQGLYRAAGLHGVGLAVRGGLAPDRARLLENLFRESDRGNG